MAKQLSQIIKFIEGGVKEVKKTPPQTLGKFVSHSWRPIKGQLEYPGVYVIYQEKRKQPLYVGSAGKGGHYLKYRISDLFAYGGGKWKFKHTLTEKLLDKLGRFRTIDGLRAFYLVRCRIKIIRTKTIREARILEDVLIELLQPKYNQE